MRAVNLEYTTREFSAFSFNCAICKHDSLETISETSRVNDFETQQRSVALTFDQLERSKRAQNDSARLENCQFGRLGEIENLPALRAMSRVTQ